MQHRRPSAHSPRRALMALLLLIPLAFVLPAACGGGDDPSAGESCSGDTDCPDDQYCREGTCARDCDPSGAGDACDEGQMCSERGECVAETVGECSENSDCDEPPMEAMCDGDVSVQPPEFGQCSTGDGGATCEYTAVRESCANGCDAATGLCRSQTDPCEDVVCDSPREPYCEGDDLVTERGPGTCQGEGDCSYIKDRKTCVSGCSNGACEAGQCDGVMCDMSPGDECDGNIAVSYAEMGMCVEVSGSAECRYDRSFEHCSYEGASCALQDDRAVCTGAITQVGGLVIAEYMNFPRELEESGAEWIEVVNVSNTEIDLKDWTLRSGSFGGGSVQTHEITTTVQIAPGARALLANDAYPAGDGSVEADYVYGGDLALFFEDYVELVNPSDEIADRLFWENGATLQGHARQFDPGVTLDAAANDNFSNWCPNLIDTYGVDDANYGTPGAENSACEPNACQEFGCVRPEAFCEDTSTAVSYSGDTSMCQVSRFNNPFCEFTREETTCEGNTPLCAEGACRAIPTDLPAEGEVIFTEFMGDPGSLDSQGEWLELYNTTDRTLSLFTLEIAYLPAGGAMPEVFQILDPNAVIGPKSHVVFAVDTNPAVNGGIQDAYELQYGLLKNSGIGDAAFALRTSDGSTTIDTAYYTDPKSKKSQQLSLTAYDGVADAASANDDGTNFCDAKTDYDATRGKGTPGAANEACN